MIKKILFLLLSVILLSTLLVSYVSAASPLAISKYDITKTSTGAQIAQEAVQRWTGHDWNVNCSCNKDLKVYEINSGDYLVAPASAKIKLESIQQPDGSFKLEPSIVTLSPSDPLLGTEDVSTMSAPYWNMEEAECFARISNWVGWIDNCYQIYKLIGDTDSQYDYFQLEHYATACSQHLYSLRYAQLTCQRDTQYSSTMYWVDWYPRSDIAASQCSSITLGISVFGVSLSYASQICKSGWDMTRYTDAGKFSNKWYGCVGGSEREVAYMVCVKVPQGGYPVWDLTAGYGCSLLCPPW